MNTGDQPRLRGLRIVALFIRGRIIMATHEHRDVDPLLNPAYVQKFWTLTLPR
jgi:hypothetical protein